ncbi:endonuclease/exonuclease/phosphatase family protein [Bacteriovoracaceae bacterium]|nr:endonuclease/exonuclease/phosphatase family protein [Bacteriovoracaceae bacterium]
MDKIVCLILVYVFCVATTHSKQIVSVMSYNAENLFDTTHDIGKKDHTYLPLSVKRSTPEYLEACRNIRNTYYRHTCLTLDWTESILKQKIQNLARVIKESNNGNSPDILVLQEIENINVLRQLRDQGLAKEGYREVILIEGPDNRGIDVGILSKVPLAEPAKLHLVDLDGKGASATRGILEATFKVGQNKITVFGNHWPSQMNSDYHRVAAAKAMLEAAKNIDNPLVVTGDFNTAPSDDPNAIEDYLLNPNRDLFFFDGEWEAYGEYRGTHHYRGEWTSLDRIFLLEKTMDSGCRYWWGDCFTPMWNTFKIVKKDFMLKDLTYTDNNGDIVTYEGVPNRFDPKTGEGYSDHLPVLMKFQFR